MGTRSKKAVLNIFALAISEIIVFITSLILPRVILAYYGSSYNGLVLSISQFLRYISVLTLGVAGPTRVALYRSLTKDTTEETSGIIKATETYFRKIARYFILYAIALCIVLPVLKRAEFATAETLILVLIISVGTFFEYCFGITYKTLLDADQRMYIYVLVQTVVKILNVAVSVLLIISGASIFVAQLYASLCNAACPVFIYWYVRKKYRIRSDVEPDYSGLSQRKDAAASSIANIVHSNTDSFLLTIFGTSNLVSVYSVYMLIMGGMQSIMRIFTTGLEAAFGNMWALGEIENIKEKMRLYEFAVYSFVAVAFSCTGLLILPFISLYTSGVYDTNYIRPGFAILLTITTAMFCIRQPYLTMVQAAGKYKETKNGAILEAVLNFSLSLILIHRFDLIGITVGTLVANIIRTGQYAMYMSKNLINRSMKSVIYRLLWTAASSAIIVCIYELLMRSINIGTWATWFVVALGTGVVAIVVVMVMGALFYRADMRSFITVANRLLHKRG